MNFIWIVKLLTKIAWAKNDGHRVKEYIRAKQIERSSNLNHIDRSRIKVCAVQQEIQLIKNYKQYVDRMIGFVEQGVKEGAQLIVFPEYNGALILGMLPLIKTIIETNAKRSKHIPSGVAIDKTTNMSIDIAEILSILTPFLLDIFKTTFSELASHFGVYIMSGSIMVAGGDSIYNRAFLFKPDGGIVGSQDKLHLVMMEKTMGMSMGEELSVFNTSIGKLAFPICMDATYFETFKAAKDKGAHIVMIPIANMEEYLDYFALRGIWPRVQESGVYGIKSALVGDLYGMKFTGKAGIFAPLILSPEGDGILKLSETYDRDELVVCDLDLNLIESYYDPYFSDQNSEFFNKYFPRIYEESCQHCL
jgi:predicted amidohydrolase